MAMTPDSHGYPQVLLNRKEGKPRRRRLCIHQIVLLAFVGPPPRGQVGRHVLNNDPMDNRLENLAYGTHKQNAADRWRHGTACLKRGPYRKRAECTIQPTEPSCDDPPTGL